MSTALFKIAPERERGRRQWGEMAQTMYEHMNK
jgi:hypothetical protein